MTGWADIVRSEDEAGLLGDAIAWVNRLTSGSATHADADALSHWRAQSHAHDAAFREATRLRAMVKAAARGTTTDPVAAMPRAGATWNRRIVIGGAIAASAAGVALIIPGVRAPRADFVTAKGESRKMMLAKGILVELNTATEVVRRPDLGRDGIELLSGEAAMTAALDRREPFVVAANMGRTIARRARFNIRCDDDAATVTCLEGDVLVRAGGDETRLMASQQLRYDAGGLGRIVPVDAARIAAWRDGMLIFEDRPLREVVAEVNRYRPGRIVIAGGGLGDRRLSGTFYVKRTDQVVDQMRAALDARVVRLPGDIVLLT